MLCDGWCMYLYGIEVGWEWEYYSLRHTHNKQQINNCSQSVEVNTWDVHETNIYSNDAEKNKKK